MVDRQWLGNQDDSGHGYGKVDDGENAREQPDTVLQGAPRLAAQPLPQPGPDEGERLTHRAQGRTARREDGRVQDLVALTGAVFRRERAPRESQQPAHQVAALAARVSTTRAARRMRAASAASAPWPSCVSVYERRTRPST